MSVEYQGGKKFDTWEDWVEWHDQRDHDNHQLMSKTIGQAVGQFIKEYFKNHTAKQIEKLTEPLKKRIAELEKMPQLKYVGVYSPQTKYRENNLVSHQGSMWVCKVEETSAWPGGSDNNWQLVVKRGKDAAA